jgi:hypothetical protein
MKTINTRTFIGSVIAVFTSVWEWFNKDRKPPDDGDPWHTLL